eukprot:gnl/MRDRNA2_/MRDRNA2_110236_c0_seq1.p1 gnl/MRDRNA2_/MRDRNA2_110236_c0~~gnl/MRDRNA2_/MRDRNA2_110236_c0_seq1.p1  ORF type:complete len:931 (-),score=212.46 gnl/MRDRNA2_/MRDRNA2_110236_c0_seq1:131-2923(-)
MGLEMDQLDADQLYHSDKEIKEKMAMFSEGCFENLWTEINTLGLAPNTMENHSALTILGVMTKSYHIMQAAFLHQLTGSLQRGSSNNTSPRGGKPRMVSAQQDDGERVEREFSQTILHLTHLCEGEWAALSNHWPDNSREMEEIQDIIHNAAQPGVVAKAPPTRKRTKAIGAGEGGDGGEEEAPDGVGESAGHPESRATALRRHDGRQLLSLIAQKVKDAILVSQSAEQVKILHQEKTKVKDQYLKEKKDRMEEKKRRQELEIQLEAMESEARSLRAQLEDAKRKSHAPSKNDDHPPEPARDTSTRDRAHHKKTKGNEESEENKELKQELKQAQQGLSQAEKEIKAKAEEIASLQRRLQRTEDKLQKKASETITSGPVTASSEIVKESEDLVSEGHQEKTKKGDRRMSKSDTKMGNELEAEGSNSGSASKSGGRSGDLEDNSSSDNASVTKLKKQLEEEKRAKKSWEDRANAAERKLLQLQQQQSQDTGRSEPSASRLAEHEKIAITTATTTTAQNDSSSAATTSGSTSAATTATTRERPQKVARELISTPPSTGAAPSQPSPTEMDWSKCPKCHSELEKSQKLKLAIEELKSKIAKLMQKLSEKVDNQDLEEFVDQAGLGSVMKCKTHSVFERLYQDAIVRLQRLASLQEHTRAQSSDQFVRVMRAIGVSFEEASGPGKMDAEDVANMILHYFDHRDPHGASASGSHASMMSEPRPISRGPRVLGGPYDGSTRNPPSVLGQQTSNSRPISRQPSKEPPGTEFESNGNTGMREGRLPRPGARGGSSLPAGPKCDSRGASPRHGDHGRFANPADNPTPIRAWANGVQHVTVSSSHHGDIEPVRQPHRPPTILSAGAAGADHKQQRVGGGGPPRPLTLASAVGCPGGLGLAYSRLGRSTPSLHGRCGSPGPATNSGTFREYWRPQSAIAASH